jgi:hypothetical protein
MTLSDRAVLEQARDLAQNASLAASPFVIDLGNAVRLLCDILGRQQQPPEAVSVPAPVEYEGLALALINAWQVTWGRGECSRQQFQESGHVRLAWLAVAKRAEEWFARCAPDNRTALMIRDRARLGEE